jgi:hypothetical protein
MTLTPRPPARLAVSKFQSKFVIRSPRIGRSHCLMSIGAGGCPKAEIC